MEVRTLLLVTALGGALFHKQYAPASTAAPAFVGPLFPGTAIPARSSRWANIGSRVNDSRGIARLVGAIGGTAKDDCAHRWGHRFARVGTAAAGGTNPDVNGSLLMPSLTVADSNCHSCPPPPVGTAFTAVARCRGGGGAAGREGASAVADGAASDTATGDAAATVEVLSGEMQKNRLLLDHVEDVMGDIGRLLTVVGTPAFHFFRFGFGLCLIFYGMAFRTFAFHVIVFRISGFKQVHIALGKLSIKYRSARQSIREAAAAAKSAKRAREQLEHHNKLKVGVVVWCVLVVCLVVTSIIKRYFRQDTRSRLVGGEAGVCVATGRQGVTAPSDKAAQYDKLEEHRLVVVVEGPCKR